MKLARWMESHARSLVFLFVAAALAGGVLTTTLPVGLFPNIGFPRLLVEIDAGDRPADRMAIEVTRPIEESLRAIPGLRSVRSTTSRGSAEISMNFGWNDDIIQRFLLVDAAIRSAIARLPPGTTYEVHRMDPTLFPVIGFSLTSAVRPISELRDLALFQIRPALTGVEGVTEVGIQGGSDPELRVVVNPEQLDARGLTVAEVAEAINHTNSIEAVGRSEDGGNLYLLLAISETGAVEDLENVVVTANATGIVRVRDVATVRETSVPVTSRITADGRDAVIFQIFQTPGGNSVAIAEQIRGRLATLSHGLPADVRVANWYDQSTLVQSAFDSVRDTVLIGVGLAVLVIFIFLRNLKVAAVVGFVVPIVLAATVCFLALAGMSFNIMTLGGMAAAVGLIIDDAIVMIEHLDRRSAPADGGESLGLFGAAAEFTRPLLTSSLATIVIFVPLALLTGVTGAFFKALSFTMGSALAVSCLIAWLGVPVIARNLIHTHPQRPVGVIERAYVRVMGGLMRAPWLAGVALALLGGCGFVAYQRVGSGFMPAMDEGGFVLDYFGKPGTSLTEMDRQVREIEKILQQVPEVQTYSRRTGEQLGGGLTESNEGDFFVRLKPFPRRPVEEVIDDVRERIDRVSPTLDVEMLQLMEDVIGDLTAVPQPIEIQLFGDDLAALLKLAPEIATSLEGVPGVVDVNDGLHIAGGARIVRVKRDEAALQGLDPDEVATQISAALDGVVATSIRRGSRFVDVRVCFPNATETSLEQLGDIRLRALDGHLVRVGSIADIEIEDGQPQITHMNMSQMVAVTGRISERDMGSVIADVRKLLDAPGRVPSGVRYELGGLYAEQQTAFRGLAMVFGGAIVLLFALLLFSYESFGIAAAMLLTTLCSVAGVFVGLEVTNTALDITSMMGLTMVLGIVTEVGIFFVTEFRELDGISNRGERLIAAGRNRMRPIAMTTVAAILALAPLALGLGEGAQMLKPLAIAIIAGLVIQFPLALVLLPCLLAMLRDPEREIAATQSAAPSMDA